MKSSPETLLELKKTLLSFNWRYFARRTKELLVATRKKGLSVTEDYIKENRAEKRKEKYMYMYIYIHIYVFISVYFR